MGIKKTISLIGIVIGLFGSRCWADELVIDDPLLVDIENVNTNHYGGAFAILGLRVMEGANTLATGYASHAGGEGAMATNNNTFVWSDGLLFGSTLPYQFSAYASNGYRLFGGPISGDGSGLTNLHFSGSLPTNSVTSDKLASGAVTAAALAPGSVGSSAIATGAVTSVSLAASSIGTNKAVMTEWNNWGNTRYMAVAGSPDLVLGEPGRIVGGYGMSVTNISESAYGAVQLGMNDGFLYNCGAWGALQLGYNWGMQMIESDAHGASQQGENWGTQTIGSYAIGASQWGANYGEQLIDYAWGALQRGANYNTQFIDACANGASQQGENWGTQIIGIGAFGASQFGLNYFMQTIGDWAFGASQFGLNDGTMAIGGNAYGAEQRGFADYNSAATNAGVGSIQLINLTEEQTALITGHAAIGLGACTVTHDQAIVAGDGLASRGKGTVTALGFYGNGAGLTNLSFSAPLADSDAVSKAYLRSVLSALPPQGDLSMGSYTNGAPATFPLTF